MGVTVTAGNGFPSGTQGDVLYYDGSAWVVLNAGTSGYFLKTQGAGANPAWASAAPSSPITSNFIGSTYASTIQYIFQGDSDTGMWSNAGNVINFKCGGNTELCLQDNLAQFKDGLENSPGIQFISDSNTGMYRVGNDTIGFSTNATKRLEISTAATTTTLPLYAESTKRVACGGGTTGSNTTANGTVALEINGTTYYLLKAATADA